MDWDNEYQILANEVIEGKLVSNKETIDGIKSMTETHRINFMKYHTDKIKEIRTNGNALKNLQSYKTVRSKVKDFLLYCSKKYIKPSDVSLDVMENYFLEYINEEAGDTFETRVSFIQSFINNYPESYTQQPNLSEIRSLSEYIEFEKQPAKALSSKQVEDIRSFFNNRPFELFIFEFLFNLEFTLTELKKYNYNDFDEESQTITLGKKTKKVDAWISNLIDLNKSNIKINSKKDLRSYLKKIEKELVENKIIDNHLRPIDIKETRKKLTSMTCPECGETYPATSEYWVLKQYQDNERLWLVCMQNCSKEEKV